MGMEVGELFVAMSLDIAGLRRQLDQARSEAAKGGSRIQASLDRAAPASKKLLGGIGLLAAATGGLAVKSLGLAGDLEQVEVAFTTMLGSGEKARDLLADLNRFAATTPFQFPELARAAKMLSAFGVGTEELIPSLRRIGDVAAGISAPIGEIAEVYGKAKVQGRLFMEDINQLTGRGIPIIQELAKQFGVSESQVRKLVEEGKVGFPHIEEAFRALTSEGGKFAGLMEAQSKTLPGLWSTIKDNITLTLAPIGRLIVDVFDLKGVAERAIAFLERVRQGVEDFRVLVQEKGLKGALEELIPPEMHGKIVMIAGALAGALVPALWALAKAAWAAVAPLLPWIAAGAAIAGLAYLIYTNWDKLTAWFRETWTTFVEWITGVWKRITTAAVALAVEVAQPFVNAFTWLREQWQAFTAWLSDVWEGFRAWLAGLAAGVGAWALETYERVTAPFQAAVAWLTRAWQTFGDWWHSWWDGLAAWVSRAVDRVLAPIRAIIDWVKDALDWLDTLFGGEEGDAPAAYAPAAPPPAGKSTIVVPGLQHGGIAMRPTVAVIAEDRPEAVVPLDRFWQRMPGPITILVELDGRTLARAVLPELHSEIVLRTGLA